MKTYTQAPKKSSYTRVNLAARLAYYKALVEHYDAKHGQASDWRYYRSWAKPLALESGKHSANWSQDRQTIFVDDLKDCPFIFEGDAGDLAKIGHTGWYTDHYCDNLVKGAVMSFRNPGRLYGEDDNTGNQTHKVYLAAYYETDADGATIDYSYFYETARAAAYGADRLAERAAEKEREFQAKDQAERDIEDHRADIHRLNKETLALIKEVKQQASIFPATVCDLIRDHIESVVEQRREKFERIAALQANFWLITE
jgi:hypothetical protein